MSRDLFSLRKPNHMPHLWRMLLGLALIFDGLVYIIALGFISSSFALRVCYMHAEWKRDKEESK